MGLLGFQVGIGYPVNMYPNAIEVNLDFIFAGNGYHEVTVFLFRMIEAETKLILAVKPIVGMDPRSEEEKYDYRRSRFQHRQKAFQPPPMSSKRALGASGFPSGILRESR